MTEARDAAQQKIRNTERAIERVKAEKKYDRLNEAHQIDAYERLIKEYQDEIRDLEDQLGNVDTISSAYSVPLLYAADTFTALDEASEEFKHLSFADASSEMMAIISARHPEEERVVSAATGLTPEQLAQHLTDEGLDAFAEQFGFPVASGLETERAASARALYSAMVPLLCSLDPQDTGAGVGDGMSDMLEELVVEAIEATATHPVKELETERGYSQRLPYRLEEYDGLTDADPGPMEEGNEELETLKIQKAFILRMRDQDRNKQVIRGVLAIFGLEFFMDLGQLEYDSHWDFCIDQMMNAGDMAIAATFLRKVITDVVTKPGFWSTLVEKQGRFGAVRTVAGLGGRLVPAIFAISLAFSWATIYADWQKKKKSWDRDLERLYGRSDAQGKEELFMDNLGYIPGTG